MCIRDRCHSAGDAIEYHRGVVEVLTRGYVVLAASVVLEVRVLPVLTDGHVGTERWSESDIQSHVSDSAIVQNIFATFPCNPGVCLPTVLTAVCSYQARRISRRCSRPRRPITRATSGRSATCLRACYALSGTDLAHGATCLRACYALSGTDLACTCIGLRACYALSGTDLAYAATAVPH
eukprot:2472361-Rhodomonas_salina.1